MHVLGKWLQFWLYLSGGKILPMVETLIRCSSRNTISKIIRVNLIWKKMNLKILSFFLGHPVVIMYKSKIRNVIFRQNHPHQK